MKEVFEIKTSVSFLMTQVNLVSSTSFPKCVHPPSISLIWKITLFTKYPLYLHQFYSWSLYWIHKLYFYRWPFTNISRMFVKFHFKSWSENFNKRLAVIYFSLSFCGPNPLLWVAVWCRIHWELNILVPGLSKPKENNNNHPNICCSNELRNFLVQFVVSLQSCFIPAAASWTRSSAASTEPYWENISRLVKYIYFKR